MRILLRASESLIERARADLSRSHPFAWERVGWLAVKPAMAGETLLLLAQSYHPVADNHYVHDMSVGARVGEEAMTSALNVALREKVGMFHIHHHAGPGTPIFSGVDVSEQPKLVLNFLAVRRGCPHGALLFSDNGLAGSVWLSRRDIRPIDEFHSVGQSSRTFFPGVGDGQ